MYDERVNLIREGMSVEDADGDTVGTVKAVYQAHAGGRLPTASNASPAGDAYLKVHAGLPFIGKNAVHPVERNPRCGRRSRHLAARRDPG